MAGKSVEPPTNVVEQVGGETGWKRSVEANRGRVVTVDIAREPIDLGLGEAQSLSDIAQHRPRSISDNVGHHRGPFASIAAIAVLDHLLPAIGFEIEIDVGRPAPLCGQEPFEGQTEPDRIDSGQPETAAHCRVGPRAADLAVDVLAAGKLDDVPDHEEIAGKAE